MECTKCGGPVSGKFRLIWDGKHYLHLCEFCSRRLEAFVHQYGDIGPISMKNPRFRCWLEEERFMSLEEALMIRGSPDEE